MCSSAHCPHLQELLQVSQREASNQELLKNQRFGPIAQLVDRQAISQNLHNPNLVKSSTSDSLRRVSSYETCVVAPRGIGNLYLRAVVHVS